MCFWGRVARHNRDNWGNKGSEIQTCCVSFGFVFSRFELWSGTGIRRFAALALATSGTRAQAVAVKEYLAAGSSLTRTALLLATCKLGKDERKYLRRGLNLQDFFEKICAEAKI